LDKTAAVTKSAEPSNVDQAADAVYRGLAPALGRDWRHIKAAAELVGQERIGGSWMWHYAPLSRRALIEP